MDPNYKEDEEGGSSSNTAQSAPVKLEASKANNNQNSKKGCC